MILKLREDVRRKEDSTFSLKKFHNDFLLQGVVPLPIVRRALLGETLPVL